MFGDDKDFFHDYLDGLGNLDLALRLKRIVEDKLGLLDSELMELKEILSLKDPASLSMPFDELSPVVWVADTFPAIIVEDNQDGSYKARRVVAEGANNFIEDSENPEIITVYNVEERQGYTGALSLGQIVRVFFDGIDPEGRPIYHVY